MRGPKSPLTILLTDPQREELEGWQRRPTMPAGLVRRARAILLLADGQPVLTVAKILDMQRRHVRKWARRFRTQGLAGLHDSPRPGRKPVFSPRRGDAHGQAGLREARHARPVALAMGLC